MLKDNHGRDVNYLRLAITDRCNLRCQYCMPAAGLEWLPRRDLLTYEEMLTLMKAFSELGIQKVRFTGGEPFIRRDFIHLLEEVSKRNWFKIISLTTNGVLTAPHVPMLKKLGIHSVNLSLDSINKERFAGLTLRDELAAVMQTFQLLVDSGIKTRINAVVMEGKNEDDIEPLSRLAESHPVDVRFIEEMPFNGVGDSHAIRWNAAAIVQQLKAYFPGLEKVQDEKYSTSFNYSVPGFKGRLGVIAAYTRSFCGSCNRLRVTPTGNLKTCLYGEPDVNLRDALRQGIKDKELKQLILLSVGRRKKDGHESENDRKFGKVTESMATIGG